MAPHASHRPRALEFLRSRRRYCALLRRHTDDVIQTCFPFPPAGGKARPSDLERMHPGVAGRPRPVVLCVLPTKSKQSRALTRGGLRIPAQARVVDLSHAWYVGSCVFNWPPALTCSLLVNGLVGAGSSARQRDSIQRFWEGAYRLKGLMLAGRDNVLTVD